MGKIKNFEEYDEIAEQAKDDMKRLATTLRHTRSGEGGFPKSC